MLFLQTLEFMEKAIFCWSGGKDSSYCLHKVLSEKIYDVKYLLTTVNLIYNRVSMHGVRLELLYEQARATGIELLIVHVSGTTNDEYEKRMAEIFLKAKSEGIHHVIYGDIFLEDLRAYREEYLTRLGMTGVFPVWKTDTQFLVKDFLDKGFKAIVCCVNDAFLGEESVGKEFNASFISSLPANVDPAGENGEFHTFCYAGPIFSNKLKIITGEKVYKKLELQTDDYKTDTKGFWYCDLF